MPRTRRRPAASVDPEWVPSPGSGYVRSWPFCAPQWATRICAGWLLYALCCTAELGIWIALLIYAYAHGGTAAGATIVLVQLVPCIVLGPFLGAVADVRDPQRVVVGMVGQVVSMGALAGAIAWGAPEWVVFTLAPMAALSITLTRPTQAALFPAVVRTPEELTAANVMSGWTYGVACLVGPALAGALVAWVGRRWPSLDVQPSPAWP